MHLSVRFSSSRPVWRQGRHQQPFAATSILQAYLFSRISAISNRNDRRGSMFRTVLKSSNAPCIEAKCKRSPQCQAFLTNQVLNPKNKVRDKVTLALPSTRTCGVPTRSPARGFGCLPCRWFAQFSIYQSSVRLPRRPWHSGWIPAEHSLLSHVRHVTCLPVEGAQAQISQATGGPDGRQKDP